MITLLLISFYVCISLVLVAQAQTVTQPPIIPSGATDQEKLYIPHNIGDQSNKAYLETRLLPGIASTIIGLAGGLSLIFVIISGIQLLTSYGNSDAAGKAKKTLTWAVAGIIIASLSYAVVRIVASITVPK
jgi:hypothetical protein